MKKFLIAVAFLACTHFAKAQFELKTNPIAILFEALPVSLEYVLNDYWGMEVNGWISQDFSFLYFSGQHYFNPNKGGDKFNIGAFTGVTSDNGFGLGFFFGYKVLSSKNVLVDLALGVGRDFSGEVEALPYGKLFIGYRFGAKK